MTAVETQQFKPTFEAIRKGYVDPDLLNSIATGNVKVVDNTKVIPYPATQIDINEKGFTTRMVSKASKTVQRRNKYKG